MSQSQSENHPPSRSQLRRKLATVDRRLEGAYGPPPRRQRPDPLSALVATILSQNTNDTNSGRAFEALREAFPTWQKAMEAPLLELERVLRPGGLAKTKSARIQRILRSVARQGPLDLSFLDDLSDGEAEKALLTFDGVGPKTARCVLLFSLGRDVFPIDTHIERILKRMGILPPKMPADKAHDLISGVIPRGRSLPLHLNLIRHGRTVCHPRNPECDACPLRRSCSHHREKK